MDDRSAATRKEESGFFAALGDITLWAKLAEIAGIIMAIVSACFTVKLMRSFATDNSEYWLYTIYGGTVQLAQNCLFVYAVYLHRAGQGFKALTAFLLFCLLFVLSLAGTMGSFIVSNKTQNNQELTQDIRLQDMQRRADSLDRQIERSQSMMEAYQERKMLTKGAIPEGKRLDSLNAERAKLSKDMANYKTEGTSDALHIALGKLFDCSPEDAKVTLFSLYAVALDLVSAVMLAYSLGLLSAEPKIRQKTVSESQDHHEEPAYYPPVQTPAPAMVSKTQPVAMSEQTENLQKMEQPPVQYSTVQDRQPIGFTAKAKSNLGETKNIPKDTLKRYITTAYKGKDMPNTLLGRRAISDRIGITNDESDQIHSLLKRRRIVEINGNKTIPRMTMTEAIETLSKETSWK